MTATTDRFVDHQFVGPVIRYLQTNAGILFAFAVLFIALSFSADAFLTWDNWLNIMRSVSTNALLAIGVMLTIMLAGIDLAGGALIAACGVTSVVAMERMGLPIGLAVVLGLALGLAAGLINGTIIAYTGIHPFVVTLAMMSIARGAAYLIADGQPVSVTDPGWFEKIGSGFIGPIPMPVIYMAIAFIGLSLFLNKTRLGRNVYAVGGNPVAARYSGINIVRVKIVVWTMSAGLAAWAGIVMASRLSSGQPNAGTGFETDAIAAAVVGGTSFYGGTGKAGGVFIGVLVIGLISNGLNLLHVNTFWQYVAKGVIILIAVYFDMYRKRKEETR